MADRIDLNLQFKISAVASRPKGNVVGDRPPTTFPKIWKSKLAVINDGRKMVSGPKRNKRMVAIG